ncbi:MAG TPA: AraC family transcriptional regulator [Burkholderiaceae bacterium]|nr:AraC family transcriptional regulator [Burkholderiaceae bacterium]
MKNQPATHLFLWRGSALVIGPSLDSKLHSHFAMQLTFGLDQAFRVRLSEDDRWIDTKAAIFAPNQDHQVDCGGRLAHLFVELPLRGRGDLSTLDAGYDRLPAFEVVRKSLSDINTDGLDLEAAEDAVRVWLECAFSVNSANLARPDFDPRIAQTLDWIATRDNGQISGDELAARVHLSPSRFTHLFRQQTGLPLTRYLLWTRLLVAVEAVAEGANTTAAAHMAGFADLAHMSRTFRNTFGVMPSELQKMTIAFKRKSGEMTTMKA